uniref:Lectin C-type domain-containing protein n=1 Tax=Wuchereria bancrofti TaxID=6293 RepID=A0A1I8ELL6_WUCBA
MEEVLTGINSQYHLEPPVVAVQIGEHEDIICFDGTLAWKQDLNKRGTPCFGVAKVKSAMDWNKANDYCKETGGQLPTPTNGESRLLEIMLSEIGSEAKIPLGIVHEKSKWMYIRDGQKNNSDLTKVKPSLEILRLSTTTAGLQYEAALKRDKYTAVICEHRNSALSVIENQECDNGFVLLAINNASKCYLLHEFSNPLMDANDFKAVSSYCKSQSGELFEPIDSGDLLIMQKIGEASGYAVRASSKNIHQQYGYINQKIKNAKEEPITAAGYKYSTVGINVIVSNSTDAFCFMLELPGGLI